MGALGRDVKFANRTAVTQVASEARKNLSTGFKQQLKDPVPFFTKAYRFKPARNIDNPVAEVFINDRNVERFVDSVSRTGEHQTIGITRFGRSKGILKRQESLVPTKHLKRTSRGNISPARAKKIINDAKTKIVESGKWRGVYIGSGKQFKAVYVPAVVDKYKPPVDLEGQVEKANKLFPKFYGFAYAKNRDKTLRKQAKQLVKAVI